MKPLFITFCLFICTMFIKAQYQTIPLWESTPPNNKDVTTEEVRSISGSGAKVLTKVTTPELWWFKSSKKGVCPAIVICPGGGYTCEAYEHEGTQVAEWLASLGYNALVLKYRLPDETLFTNPTYIPLMDVRQAFVLLRKKASEMNIAPQEIGIMGFSAGGHLAASAATLFSMDIPFSESGQAVRPDFSILLYPVISLRENLTHKGSRITLLGNTPSESLIKTFSLDEQVTPNTPPTFILCATDDPAVNPDNTIRYAEALQKNKVPVKKIILPKGGHGFGFRKESPAFVWTEQLSTWLKETRANTPN